MHSHRDPLSYESTNSVFVKFELNPCVLTEGNIPNTNFEQKILLWQRLSITIPTAHSIAYSLPASYYALRRNEVSFATTRN